MRDGGNGSERKGRGDDGKEGEGREGNSASLDRHNSRQHAFGKF